MEYNSNNNKIDDVMTTMYNLNHVDHNIYNTVLHQLHLANQAQQETTNQLIKEQARNGDLLAKLMVDMEQSKETLNNRLDGMMQNIDLDIKKLYQDMVNETDAVNDKITNKIELVVEEFVKVKEFQELREDITEIKEVNYPLESRYDQEQSHHKCSHDFDKIYSEFETLKKETNDELIKHRITVTNLNTELKESCVRTLVEYVNTELNDQIVQITNEQITSDRSDQGTEMEKLKIQLDDLKMTMVKMKTRIVDIEQPARCWDESELFAASMDDARFDVGRSVTLYETPGSVRLTPTYPRCPTPTIGRRDPTTEAERSSEDSDLIGQLEENRKSLNMMTREIHLVKEKLMAVEQMYNSLSCGSISQERDPSPNSGNSSSFHSAGSDEESQLANRIGDPSWLGYVISRCCYRR